MKTIPPELEGEYTVRVVDMPLASPGFVTYDDDDHANIYLNARYNHETNQRTADHEFTHVLNDDIHNDDDIRTVETRAHRGNGLLDAIPCLIRASDLLPQSKPEKAKSVQLSPYQAQLIFNAISDLDRIMYSEKEGWI